MRISLLLVAGLLLAPASALADRCADPCGSPCPKAECPRTCEVKTVKCCQRVKVCVPVEKVKSRLVKTYTCEAKVHTKCVKDKCDPCVSRQVTWTTYHRKARYHWERYVVTEYKTRYVKRCTESVVTATAKAPAAATLAAAK